MYIYFMKDYTKQRIAQRTPEYLEKKRLRDRTPEYREKTRLRILKYSKTKKGRGNIKAQSRRRYERGREFILNFKKDKCCVFCGYKEHPEILQFHHQNRAEKKKEISEMTTLSLKRVQSEIDKCILLCPNCHSLHHLKKEELLNAPRTD